MPDVLYSPPCRIRPTRCSRYARIGRMRNGTRDRRKPARKSNFELLRLVAMLAIVVGHLFGQGRVTAHVPASVWLPSLMLANGARLAVGLFALLGCWFLVEEPDFRPGRWLRIHATVLSYTVPLTAVAAVAWGGVDAWTFARAFLPVLGRPLWFASAWLTLLALSPVLHSAAFSCTRRGLCLAAAALLAAISVPATFAGTLADDYFSDLLWFVFLYLFVAWLKRGAEEPFKKIPRLGALAAGLAIYAAPVLVEWAVLLATGPCRDAPAAYKLAQRALSDFKSLPMFVSSLCLFAFFAKTDIGSRRWINFLARPAFAVYVAHQTPAFWPHLWRDVFRCREWYGHRSAPLVALGCAVAVYAAVAAVETARLALVSRGVRLVLRRRKNCSARHPAIPVHDCR